MALSQRFGRVMVALLFRYYSTFFGIILMPSGYRFIYIPSPVTFVLLLQLYIAFLDIVPPQRRHRVPPSTSL
jgi:hypothetical protein